MCDSKRRGTCGPVLLIWCERHAPVCPPHPNPLPPLTRVERGSEAPYTSRRNKTFVKIPHTSVNAPRKIQSRKAVSGAAPRSSRLRSARSPYVNGSTEESLTSQGGYDSIG